MVIRERKRQLLLKGKIIAMLRKEVDELRKVVSGSEAKMIEVEGKVDNSVEKVR